MVMLALLIIVLIGVPVGLHAHSIQSSYVPALVDDDPMGMGDTISVAVSHPSTALTISVSLNDSFRQSDAFSRQASLSRKNIEAPLTLNEQLMKGAGKPLTGTLTLAENLSSKLVVSEDWVFMVFAICLGAVLAGVAGGTVALLRRKPVPSKLPKTHKNEHT